MRLESLILGVIVLGFGIYLVSTGGSVAGVSLPGLIGIQCGGSSNSTAPGSPTCLGPAGYGIGTIVCLFGLGMIGNGLRTPSAPKGLAGGSALPPEISATLAAARQHMEVLSRTPGAGGTGLPPSGTRFCPECGRPNAADAGFCQRCGKPMPSRPSTATPPR